MAIRQSRGRWCVEFQQRGTRVFKRLPPGITKAQAQEYETKLRRGIFDGELGKKPDITLTDAIGRWLLENQRKDQRKARSEAKQWEPFVTGKLLRQAPEITAGAMKTWLSENGGAATSPNCAINRERASPPRSAATINRRLAMLKAVCKHAYKTGLIGDNLSGRITLLKGEKMREVYLTKEQVMRVAGCAADRQTASAIIIAAYTGLRASELLTATAPATTEKATLVVEMTRSKTGKPRIVPVPKPARPYLSSLPLSMDYWTLRKQFLAACKAARIKGVRFHDLRHTCASWLINEGVDLYTVGKILGHAGPQTTQRYAHLSKQTLERAMARLK